MEKSRYRNMSEEEKQRLKEYQKNYREAKKSQYNNKSNSFLIVIVIMILIVIQIKQFFNYDLIKYAIQLYIIKPLYSYYFRQTDGNKSLTIYD